MEHWLAFIADDGYRRPEFWLADGWAAVQAGGWSAPFYWERDDDDRWTQMSLRGLRPLDEAAPVCHVSYYEADAFARWAGMRLPSEAEWEIAAAGLEPVGNTLGLATCAARRPAQAAARQHPIARSAALGGRCSAMSGNGPPAAMHPIPVSVQRSRRYWRVQRQIHVQSAGSSRWILRHALMAMFAHSYRNFFYPHQRWQFSGVRLADDA